MALPMKNPHTQESAGQWSRCDHVKAVIDRELEACRGMLDAAAEVGNLTVVVSFDRDQLARRVVVRPEAATDIPAERRAR